MALVLEAIAVLFLIGHALLVFPVGAMCAMGRPMPIRTCLMLIAGGAGVLGALHAGSILLGVLHSRRARQLLATAPGIGVLLIGIYTAERVSRMPTVPELVEVAERQLEDGETTVLELLVFWEAPEAKGLARELRDRGGDDERFLGAVALYRLGDRSEQTRAMILERVETARTERGSEVGVLPEAGFTMLCRPHVLGGWWVVELGPPTGPYFWSRWESLEPEVRGEVRTPLPEESALFGEEGVSGGRAALLDSPWKRSFDDVVVTSARERPQAAARLAETYRKARGRDDLMRALALYRILYEGARPGERALDGTRGFAYLETLHALATRFDDRQCRESFLAGLDRLRESPEAWRDCPEKETLLRFERELRR
jgi:hypothetical protein